DQAEHALGDALRAGGDSEPPAVCGAIGVARRVVHRPVPGARLHLAELVIRGDLRTEEPEQRLDQREVDDLSTSARAPRVQRGHDAVRDREGRDAVRETERRQCRWTVGLASERREAAHRFSDRAEAGAFRVRAELTEPGHTREDEPGVLRREAVVTKVPALQRPGSEVLDDDIRGARDAAEEALAVGRR